MVKIVETNILLDGNNTPYDVQNRLIIVYDWQTYIDEVEGKTPCVNRKCLLGTMSGRSGQFVEGKSRYIKKTEYNFIIDHGDSLQMAYLIPEGI